MNDEDMRALCRELRHLTGAVRTVDRTLFGMLLVAVLALWHWS